MKLIVNIDTTDPTAPGTPVFWADEFGWVDAIEADIYDDDAEVDLPHGGRFCSLGDAAYFVNVVGLAEGVNTPSDFTESEREHFFRKRIPR